MRIPASKKFARRSLRLAVWALLVLVYAVYCVVQAIWFAIMALLALLVEPLANRRVYLAGLRHLIIWMVLTVVLIADTIICPNVFAPWALYASLGTMILGIIAGLCMLPYTYVLDQRDKRSVDGCKAVYAQRAAERAARMQQRNYSAA